MSGEREAFMAAILATPDDDTPRLVFADWLDENGTGEDRAHAALIRAQCRLEVLPPGGKERRALEREAKAILKEHGDRWAKALKDNGLVKGWTFRRGFLAGITMSATAFAQNAKKVFAAAPTVRAAHFPDASNEVGRLARCEYLSRLAAVDLSNMCMCGYCPIHNDLRALFGSKHTAALRELNIAGNRMDPEGAERLAKSAALERLTSLDVSDNPLGAGGIWAITHSKRLKQLATLNLSSCYLDASGLEDIERCRNLPALRTLKLQTNGLSSAAVKKFMASPLFAQLTMLDLSNNPLGDAGARVLAAMPPSAKLELLDVRRCKIGAKGKALLTKRFGKGLKV